MSLIDTLDDLVHSGRIEPQTAMKVIATFDKSITEVLADKVKARMNFKVAAPAAFAQRLWADRRSQKGSSGYLPLLRRSLDVPHQRCQFQARQPKQRHGGENQDRELQFQEAWRAVGLVAAGSPTQKMQELLIGLCGRNV